MRVQVHRNHYRCLPQQLCKDPACLALLEDVATRGQAARQDLAAQMDAEAADVAAKLAAKRLEQARLCAPLYLAHQVLAYRHHRLQGKTLLPRWTPRLVLQPGWLPSAWSRPDCAPIMPIGWDWGVSFHSGS